MSEMVAVRASQVAERADGRLVPHAAIHALPEHERAPEPSPANGRDLSQSAVTPSGPMVGRDYGKTSCPLAPQRCPFGGACHTCSAHVNGDEQDEPAQKAAEGGNENVKEAGGRSPAQRSATPCPTSVRVGAVRQRNFGDLSPGEKEGWRTWLGAMSRMDVGPGPDHTGHCMKERLTTVSNDCPAAVYSRGGAANGPCTGNRCLDINRYGNMWGVSDGPAAFLDMHRTRFRESLLEGTGVDSCTAVCEQTYSCDRTHPTQGTFRITRHFQAGSYTRSDGTRVHITTGTVTKT
jgi:hypothetical protein